MATISAAANPWISIAKPNPEASLRMFCFPYAGGGASIFYRWADYLPKNVEVCLINLPARGLRLSEAPATRLAPLICSLAKSLIPSLDKPFVFFGHSMGALISFELARYLRQLDRPQPRHLFVSGRNAPQLPLTGPPLYALPESDFLEKLRRLNGTPPRVLENSDLMRLLLPSLKADFAICETYVYTREPPLNCSISAFGGMQDFSVTGETLAAWREQTTASFSCQMFAGDHFFLKQERAELLQKVSRQIAEQPWTMAQQSSVVSSVEWSELS